MARYRARHLSWKLGRKVREPAGNVDGINSGWVHQPLRWEDNDEPVTTKAVRSAS